MPWGPRPVLFGNFDAAGVWTFGGTVPPGLSGLALTFETVGFTPTGRVGVSTFGIFLHLGGSNQLPLSYVDNCADAIVLAGLRAGVESEVFNVVDDDLPSSRQFLRQYKKNVKTFKSLYVPHALSRTLCCLWEKYSRWSKGQLPPAFNQRRWYAEWKTTRYTNDKLKTKLGWTPVVPTAEGLQRYFRGCGAVRQDKQHA